MKKSNAVAEGDQTITAPSKQLHGIRALIVAFLVLAAPARAGEADEVLFLVTSNGWHSGEHG
ncbi:MAG: hypothetical protein HQL37_15700 [Alphaproteobacteria bacterium]|nr:hypothetical protein [Alphaproteobacteria bacterium]